MAQVQIGAAPIGLLPELAATREGYLQVSPTHQIFWQESGNPDGKPIVLVHGGPGAGASPAHRRLLDPQKFRIIQISQRGAGKSLPAGELTDNAVWDQVHDMEKVRTHLGIGRWHVLGRSAGSTIAALYAIEYPGNVRSLVVANVFLGRRQDIAWLFDGEVLGKWHPGAWARFTARCGGEAPFDYYSRQLDSPDPATRRQALLDFEIWETHLAFFSLVEKPTMPTLETVDEQAMSIELNFFRHHFFGLDNYILEKAHRLRGIPGVIIAGGSDQVTPAEQARLLYYAWNYPERVNYTVLSGAGHTGSDPRVIDATARAIAAVADIP